MIFIGLQEMVELNSYNVLLKDNYTIVTEWRDTLLKFLNVKADDLKRPKF